MDPDAEAEQTASLLLRATFLMVVFTTCNTYTKKSIATKTVVTPVKNIVAEKPPEKLVVKKKHKKTIYLTFDDGPNKGTRKVMHIAEEEQVPVTMFIIGEQVYGSREQKATFDSITQCNYIEIANHSFSHAGNKFVHFYTVPDSAVNDFIRCADSLHLTSGIVRTPGRNIWRTKNITSTDIKTSTAAADSLEQKGFTAVGWDLEWHFNNKLELECSGNNLLQQIDSAFSKGYTKIPDHLVLLAHDQVYADVTDSSELHNFIKQLKTKDEYDLDFISNYPAVTNNN